MYVFRVLATHPVRLLLTLAGIALCILLILFVLGVYHGVATGSVEYVRQTQADFWVLQANTSNIMRGTSVLPQSLRDSIREDPRVSSVSPVLLFLASLRIDGEQATVLLAGSEPGAEGGPPCLADGRPVRSDGEIVLDRAFAAKHGLAVGDRLAVRDDSLRVVGISSGTNAFVTQYAFVTLAFEQSTLELPGLVSFFAVQVADGAAVEEVMHDLERRFAGRLSLHAHAPFLQRNIAEVEAGILPLFFAIALIGSVVLAIILSLILSVNILERRHDYAVMKLIGSPHAFLLRTVVSQSLFLGVAGDMLALAALPLLLLLIEHLAPEVSAMVTFAHVAAVTVAVFTISVTSGLLASSRIRRISSSEVFA